MLKKIVNVSSVNPVYNEKHTRIVEWKLRVTYQEDSDPRFYLTRTTEYTIKNLFGLGYNRLWQKRISLLAEMNRQKHSR